MNCINKKTIILVSGKIFDAISTNIRIKNIAYLKNLIQIKENK